jgi:acetamidase/formamidase
MQVFTRNLTVSHCPGVEWPDFLGAVRLGETFVVDTERYNRANGPIAIEGIQAGEDIAIHIEAIEILPPFESPNGGPFFEGIGDPVPLQYREGLFHYPNGLTLPAKPSVGNVAVLPAPTDAILALSRRDLGPPGEGHRGWGWRGVVNDPRGKHCHQDCAYLAAGSIIHLKVQVDGAGLCLADVHGYIGQGEMAFAGIEAAARVRLRVERSAGWYVDWPLIETADEIMVFCSDTNLLTGSTDQAYVDVVRRAYAEMRKVVARRIGGSIADANPIVAAALDIRNCALYGLGNFVQKDGKQPGQPDNELAQPDRDIAVVGVLPKAVFAGLNDPVLGVDVRDGPQSVAPA